MAYGATALEPPAAARETPGPPALTAALSRAERWTLVALFAAALALRVVYVFAYPFDSDEPQHLHVAWAWTKGLLPYRDVFDNHAPLFHILSAPFVALIGETPRILVLMRLTMIPLSAATLWASFLLGRRLFGARAGLWSAVICGLSPTFFFKSLEYRADVLWAALWLLAIAVLLVEGLDARRGFWGGLLLGACLTVSLKTSMLLAALAITSAGVWVLSPRPGGEAARRRAAVFAASVVGGLVLPPLAVVLFFTARGALRDLIYCTVEHNLLPDVGRWGYSRRTYLLLPILALLLVAARFIIRRFPGDGLRVAFLLLLAGSQYLLLSTVWPVHTRQDLLPFYPLFTVLLAGLLLARRQGVSSGGRRWTWSAPRAALAPAILAAVELAVLPALSPIAARGTAHQEKMLAEVLALTDPGDYVLDMKGQSVFRNRPFYHALETMTLERMARGIIEDTIPERCIATRTCVAPADIGGFPPRARRFLQDNYVVVGTLRVAGRILDRTPDDPTGPLVFDVAIPARYAVVSEGGDARGTLDGRAYDGPRDLPPGRHAFIPASGGDRLAVIWAQAAERGFSPFGGAGEAP